MNVNSGSGHEREFGLPAVAHSQSGRPTFAKATVGSLRLPMSEGWGQGMNVKLGSGHEREFGGHPLDGA